MRAGFEQASVFKPGSLAVPGSQAFRPQIRRHDPAENPAQRRIRAARGEQLRPHHAAEGITLAGSATPVVAVST